MKRENMLIAACCLAAVSVGGNIWLLRHRNATPPAPSVPEKPPSTLPAAAEFDFSDTAFADDSWKLSDEKEKDPPVSLDKPFSFEEFKAPPGAEIPRDTSGPRIMRPRKLAGSCDLYYGDTPRDSASSPP